MAAWFWLCLLLLLVLTGAIVPVLIFFKWTLIVSLVIALVGMVIIGLLALLLKPLFLIASDLSQPTTKLPASDAPEYPAYLEWANGKGRYAHYRSWHEAKHKWQGDMLEKEKWEREERAQWEKEEELWRERNARSRLKSPPQSN